MRWKNRQMDGWMHAWIGGCKKTWPWLKQTTTLPLLNMLETMSGQGVSGRDWLAPWITVQTYRSNLLLCFAFLDCPWLSAHGQLSLMVVVYASQTFLRFQARAWSVLQICKKMCFFLCPGGTNPAIQGKAMLQSPGC